MADPRPKSDLVATSHESESTNPQAHDLARSLQQLNIATASVVPLSPAPASSKSQSRDIARSFERLSVSATTVPLPASYPNSASSSPARHARYTPQPLNGISTPHTPLKRSPSSSSLQSPRASSPDPLRKASMSSLQDKAGAIPAAASSSRRASATQFTNASALVGRAPNQEADTSPPSTKHTPASIAASHFMKELELHAGEQQRASDIIVILHDSCYGHRFSRLKPSKMNLVTIVERPERILATVLGISVAYVRLGERHAGGHSSLHPNRDPLTLDSIPFKIHTSTRKLPLLSQAVTNVHGVKWMEEFKMMCDNAEAKLAMGEKELTRPTIYREPGEEAPEFHSGDLYLCSESLDAMEGATGAVCEAVDKVFQGAANGRGPHRAFVAIRPPGHHCSATYPSGFCWVNNVHVGISHAALTHGLTHAAIIDFDLHHGDGSQAITWENNKRAANASKNALPWKKTTIGYFSLHDINSFPCEDGKDDKVQMASLCIDNAQNQSIWNVHLQPWETEEEFWQLYEQKYTILLEKTRSFLRAQTTRLRQYPHGPKPKGAIFISAGFDASEHEMPGMQRHQVSVPTEFYARLTKDVCKIAIEEGTAVDGRLISVLEGGYSDRALYSGVLSHLCGMAAGEPVVIRNELSPTGVTYEMSQKIGTFNGNLPRETTVNLGAKAYDASWWDKACLDELDALVTPPPPVTDTKKHRDITPTFSSPTQSFIAKVMPSSSPRRAASGPLATQSSQVTIERGPSPPPPEVDWTVAAHELSRQLIPTDRPTKSYRLEELSGDKAKLRQKRHSTLAATAAEVQESEASSQRKSLRARKPAKALIDPIVEEEARKPASRANRRKTVAGPAGIAAEKASTVPGYAQPTTQSRRRLSAASASSSITADALHANESSRPASGGTMSFQRSSTALSGRLDHSVSSGGPSAPPVVVKKTRSPTRTKEASIKPGAAAKKTRAPAQPKEGRIKPSRVQRKAPPSVAPAVPFGGDGAADERSTFKRAAAGDSKQPADDAIDALASGMKKITINLAKAQRESRDTARKLAAEQQAEPHATTSNSNKVRLNDESIIPARKSRSSSRTRAPASSPSASLSPSPMSPVGPVPVKSQPAAEVFIPYQPEGPAAEVIVPDEPLKWLPPNTSTPAALKSHLPVFTSTSAIPFGAAKGQQKKEEMDFDIWAVPDTPAK